MYYPSVSFANSRSTLEMAKLVIAAILGIGATATRPVAAFQQHPLHHHPLYVRFRHEQMEQHGSPHSQAPCHSDIVKTQGSVLAISEGNSLAALSKTSSTSFSSSAPARFAFRRRQRARDTARYEPDVETSIVATPISYDDQEAGVISVVTAGDIDSNERNDAKTSLSTPVSYDEETGMVQTAVRAIVEHPLSKLADNSVVGLSSTLVITTGALTEVFHSLTLECSQLLQHHAAVGGDASSTETLTVLSLGHFLHYGREAIRQLVELHDEANDEDDETTE